jgi:peptide deformylase
MTLKVETGTENEVLRKKSQPVRAVTGEIRSFALDMIKTMEAEEGIGLAAPQVGRHIRMIVCKLNPTEANEVVIPMINPALLHLSDETESGEEGCLSIPGTWGQVVRAKTILVRYTDLKGSESTLELSDFNARIVQHEIDHLDGILFTDKAKGLKKDAKGEKASDGPHI